MEFSGAKTLVDSVAKEPFEDEICPDRTLFPAFNDVRFAPPISALQQGKDGA